MNHIVGWKQGECSKFESSFKPFGDLRIWEVFSFNISPVGFENLKHFSFSIQEKIILELKMCLQLATLQGGHYS